MKRASRLGAAISSLVDAVWSQHVVAVDSLVDNPHRDPGVGDEAIGAERGLARVGE